MKRMEPGSYVCYTSVLSLSNNPSPASSLNGRETKEHMWQGLKKSLRNTICYCIQEIKNRQGTGSSCSRLKMMGNSFMEHKLYFWFMCVCICVHVHVYVSLCVHMCIFIHICSCVCACSCVCVLMWGAHVHIHKKRFWGSNLDSCCKASTFLTESPPLSPGLWISGTSTTCGFLIL